MTVPGELNPIALPQPEALSARDAMPCRRDARPRFADSFDHQRDARVGVHVLDLDQSHAEVVEPTDQLRLIALRDLE